MIKRFPYYVGGRGLAHVPFARALIPGQVTLHTYGPYVAAPMSGRATEIYARQTAGSTVTFTIYHYNEAGAQQNSQACTVYSGAPLEQFESVSIDWAVTKNDYFYCAVTAGAVSSKDLEWEVRP